jgi:hypothetical protein
MAFKKTYKTYSKLNTFIFIAPYSKILKFKRTKWQRLQKNIHRILKRKSVLRKVKKVKKETSNFITLVKFPNNLYIYSSFKDKRIKSFYKKSIELKNTLYMYFNNKVSTRYYKKLLKTQITDRKKLFFELLIKPFFFLEVLLLKVGFFKTILEIKQAIIYGKILLNNKLANINVEVKEGDIISIMNTNLMLNKNIPTCLFSLIEVDYYTNTIIILKNYTDLTPDIISILFPEIINLGLFIDFIKSK